MAQRKLLLVVLTMLVLGAGALGWLLLRGSGSSVEDAELGAGAAGGPIAAAGPAAAPDLDSAASRSAAPARSAVADRSGRRDKGIGGLRGRLLLADRVPLPGVEILAFLQERSSWQSPYRFLTDADSMKPALSRVGSTRTDAQGHFQLERLPAETSLLLGIAPGTGRATTRIVERTPRRDEIVDLGDILLARGCGLSGRVADPAGKPIAGVRVRGLDLMHHMTFDRGAAWFEGDGALALSANEGLVVPTGEPAAPEAAEAALDASMREALFERLALDVRSQATVRGGTISFTPSMTSGLPIVIHNLRWGNPRSGSPAPPPVIAAMPDWSAALERDASIPETTTDAQGRFVLEGVSAVRMTLWLRKPGFCPLLKGPLATNDGSQRDLGTIVLTASLLLPGEVVDEAGRPVAGAEVVAGPASGGDSVSYLARVGRTDEQGRFTAERPADALLLAVRRGAQDPWTHHGPVPPQEKAVKIVVRAPGEVLMQVAGPDGQPVADTDVRVTSTVRSRGGDGPFVPFRPAVRVDAAGPGRWRARGAPHHPLRVLAAAPGFVPAGIVIAADRKATDEHKVRLARATPGTLVVVARGSGQPIEGARVIASPEALGNASVLWPITDPFTLGYSDARGAVPLHNLPAGTHTVLVHHPSFGWTRASVTLPGEPTRVELDAPGSLVGRVVENGLPPRQPVRLGLQPGMDLPIQDEGHWILVPVAGDGSFRVDGLTAGEYSLTAYPDPAHVSTAHFHLDIAISSSSTNEQTVTIAAGKETSIVVQLTGQENAAAAVATVAGLVRVDGEPAIDCDVSVSGDTERQALTDGNGAFQVDRVAADTDLSLTVTMPTEGEGREVLWAQSVRVQAGQTLNLRIDVTTHALRGRAVFAGSGAPVPGAQLWFQRFSELDGNSASFHAQADEQGRFQVARLPIGRYTVTSADSAQVFAGKGPIEITRGQGEITLMFEPAFTAAGRVDIAGGKAPSGYALELRGQRRNHSVTVGIEQNEEDKTWRFGVEGLPADTYQVHLRGPINCAPITVTVTANVADLSLLFTPAGR